MNSIKLSELRESVNLRFLPLEWGEQPKGIWLARKPVCCSFQELQVFCESSQWRVAYKSHLALAHTPFNGEGFEKSKFFPFPWGRVRSPFSARRLFVERGVSVAGLFNGPAAGNIWWTAYDQESKKLCRYYSAANTGVYDHFLSDGKMFLKDEDLAKSILAVSGTLAEKQDDYLRSFAGELEANEGFALYRPATEAEARFSFSVIKEMKEKLSADGGILWMSPVEDNILYFGAGGGCSGCSRLRINTFEVFSQAVKMVQPDIEVRMYPEVEDWNEAKLYESYEDLAKQKLKGPSPELLQII